MHSSHYHTFRLILALLALSFLLSPTSPAQTQTVPMEIVSFSPAVFGARGVDQSGFEYELDFTTVEFEVSGELSPGGSSFDLWSVLIMETPFDSDPVFLDFEIDLPPYRDDNGNAVPDFYDQDRAVNNVAVSGYFINPITGNPAQVNGIWNRTAGSATGTLQLSFPSLGFTSIHSFAIYSYVGDFTFSRSGQQLAGDITLTNIHDPGEVTSGPLTLDIQDPATLTWDAGSWDSSYFFTYQYDPEGDPFELIGGEYVSFFGMVDGYLYTSGQDFPFWVALIDGADSDGDGTPDLIEGGAPPATPPSLSAVRVPSGIRITITGTAGSSYALEGATDITATTWNNLQTIILVSTTHTLTLPAGQPHQFLRLRVL